MAILDDPAVRGLPLPARAALTAAGSVVGGVFGAVSRVRGAKSLHPSGAVHEARLIVRGGGPPELLAGVRFLRRRASYDGIVRFSRSLGLPEAVPDIHGMAIRLPDAHGPGAAQDLLLVTSGDGAVVHHLFVPGRGYFDRPYSSVLAYRGEGDAFLITARLAADGAKARGRGSELDDLAAASRAAAGLRYEIGVAPINGRMVPVATLEVGARLPDSAEEVRFNVRNTGGGLEPTGPINRMREWVYERSQAGWDPRG